MIKIFIDQGHNPEGANTGAEGLGLYEDEVTYEVGRYLYNLLMENGEFDVMLSRDTPNEVLGGTNAESLRLRVNMANNWGADYFVSIHTNAVSNSSANGSEAFVYRREGEAYPFAESILNSIVMRMGTRDRGVKIRPSLYVLRKTKMPAVLIELGFLTNPSDARKMRDDPYGFAYAMYQGILTYFGL